jgi:hypothetical protein
VPLYDSFLERYNYLTTIVGYTYHQWMLMKTLIYLGAVVFPVVDG